MMRPSLRHFLAILVVFSTASASAPVQAPDGCVGLGVWTAESYPAVSGLAPGSWVVQDDGHTVVQVYNGQPTLFCSDFRHQGLIPNAEKGAVVSSAARSDCGR